MSFFPFHLHPQILERISHGIVGNCLSVVETKLISPASGLILKCIGLPRSFCDHRIFGITVLVSSDHISTHIIGVTDGLILLLIVFSYQLIQCIIVVADFSFAAIGASLHHCFHISTGVIGVGFCTVSFSDRCNQIRGHSCLFA